MHLNRGCLARIASAQHRDKGYRNICDDTLCCDRHQRHWHVGASRPISSGGSRCPSSLAAEREIVEQHEEEPIALVPTTRRGRIVVDYQGRRHARLPDAPGRRAVASDFPPPAHRPAPVLRGTEYLKSVLYSTYDNKMIRSDGLHLPAPRAVSVTNGTRLVPQVCDHAYRHKLVVPGTPDIFMAMTHARRKRFPLRTAENFQQMYT